MSKVISILVAVLIFCVIIVFHELGHLIIAKKNGISVPEFSIGFGPKLCGFKIGQTEYTIRLLLFGGACRMKGEDADSGEDDEDSFNSKGVWARFATIFAGPLANFILAFILAVIVIGIIGYDPCMVTNVDENGAAYTAGLQYGDIITGFDGHKISIGRELATRLMFDEVGAEPIEVTYERDDKEYSTVITPEYVKSYKLGFYYTVDKTFASIQSVIEGSVFDRAGIKAGDIIVAVDGVEVTTGEDFNNYITAHPFNGDSVVLTMKRDSDVMDFTLTPEPVESYELGFTYNYNGRMKTTPLKVIRYSFIEVKYWIVNTVKSLGQIFTGKFSSDDVGGPVRIVSELDNTIEATKSEGTGLVVLNLINWAILISANLGVMNLLPIPALDGGRLFFILIEAVRGKPVPRDKEGLIHGIGIVILLILMVLVFFNDIRNIFFR